MKILQISSAKNFGGGEKHLVDLCRALFEKKHEVFVAVRKQNDWQDKLSFLPDKNIFHIPMRNSLDIFSAKKLANIIRTNKIEILHAHLARDYPIASFAVRLQPKSKLIITRHVLFPMKGIHKFVLGNLSKAIAVSSAVEANLEKVFPKEKIVSIPNGIEIEKYTNLNREQLNKEFRSINNIPIGAKLIGTIGELKKLKGQEDFIIAANEIANKDKNTHFIIVGKDNSYDQSYRRKLKRLVKIFELEDNFTFLDWLEDTRPLLSALDIFVSASHSESFGLAILEAMASGTPVIATKTAGAEELIKNENLGILVPINKPVDLSNAICGLLENQKATELFCRTSKEFVARNYDLQKMIEDTVKIYTLDTKLN